MRFLSENQLDSAFEYNEKGLESAKRRGDKDELAFYYYTKGNFLRRSDPDKATEFYFRAKKIFEEKNDRINLAAVYSSLGAFGNIDPDSQKVFLKKALLEYQRAGDSLRYYSTLNNIGRYFYYHCYMDSALLYHKKALDLAIKINDSSRVGLSRMNIATIEVEYKNYDSAEKYLYAAAAVIPEKDEERLFYLRFNLMGFYFITHQPDSAFYYHKLIKDGISDDPLVEAKMYGFLSKYYAESNDLKKALLYDEKSDSVEKDIYVRNNKDQLKFLELEYQAKLKGEEITQLNAKMDKARLFLIMLGFVVVLILAFSIILIRLQKQKNRKKKEILQQRRRRAEAERRLIEAELHNAELKSQYLNEKLKHTSNELAFVSAGTIQNKELLLELKDRLEGIYQRNNLQDIKTNLRDLNIMILQLLNKDNEDHKIVLDRAENINTSLIAGLKSRFPDLSDNDVNLMILIILKFNSKEIASIYNIEERSVFTRRYRLRQKLDIPKFETFEDFLERLLPDIELFDVGD